MTNLIEALAELDELLKSLEAVPHADRDDELVEAIEDWVRDAFDKTHTARKGFAGLSVSGEMETARRLAIEVIDHFQAEYLRKLAPHFTVTTRQTALGLDLVTMYPRQPQ